MVGVNLEESQHPDEMDALWVDIFCFGDRPCQLSFLKKDGGGGGRRYNAAQEHKQAQTEIDTTRHTALPAHIPLLGGIGRRTEHGDDGGPPGGGGGSDGLTVAMPCWLLRKLSSSCCWVQQAVVQQRRNEVYSPQQLESLKIY